MLSGRLANWIMCAKSNGLPIGALVRMPDLRAYVSGVGNYLMMVEDHRQR